MRKSADEKNILFTLAFYDVLNYPLTAFETWKYLIADEENSTEKSEHSFKISYEKVLKILTDLERRKIIQKEKGFYFLPSQRELVKKRIFAEKISSMKIERVKKWAKVFNFIPYVRGVFLTGTLAMKRSFAEGDWDVIVVLKKNRIWLGRFFAILFLHFLKKRRHKKRTKNRFCLNHFLAEDGLKLEEKNHFSANEVIFSLPIVNANLHRKFLLKNKKWIKKIRPNFYAQKKFWMKKNERKFSLKFFLEIFLEVIFLGKILNYFCKKFMIKKIENNPKTYWRGADIRYSDRALVFLPEPQRAVIISKARARLDNLG